MCLFLPPLLIPWICIPVGFLGLVMDLYFEEALEAISRYVRYAVPFWLLLTSGMLMILHWPFLIDDKVFTP
ncbi:Nonribosomal peptide synthase sidD [Frankliniella fusca]|uniref:Nonribosomal peptide synthase sidD n=1 Tax=Frankliniella fusca TaxID=407009 RepID=A0AAE1GVT2_9NEOP|nr:Nonribosomal peptide synthase sidD [Frankliniella fusca]KAK3920949.1 Nonribosomal peptide synthase sidD [Frankliniella fusca]